MTVKNTGSVLFIITVALLLGTFSSKTQGQEPVKAVLTDPPNVPPPIQRSKPAWVQIEIETKEFR